MPGWDRRRVAFGSSRFIFATEDGVIAGWPGGTRAFVGVDNSATTGAVYKGLALAALNPDGTGQQLYATDFHNARVDVFDSAFGLVTLPGAFVDPRLPAGYAPFGIQTLGDQVLVAYAKVDPATGDEEAAVGLGFVDAFDTDGGFMGRVATRGHLNAPWGLAMAPDTFGRFKGDLLVGNFGDGQINAYRERPNGQFTHDGRLRMPGGKVLAIEGLWAIQVGNGAGSGSADSLYFTAGPDDETHGLLGRIDPAP